MSSELCACGRPLHYPAAEIRDYVESQIAVCGPNIAVTAGCYSYEVPRHYIALHGLRGEDLAALALRYGWRRRAA